MMDRYGFVALAASATVFASLFATACGSYDNGPKGTGGTGGTMTTGGTGGATGGAGTGGSAGATGGTGGAGTGGTGGATGGSAGAGGAVAGSGGMSGQAGSGAGGAPTGGGSGAGAGGAGAGGGGAGQAACVNAAPCGGEVVGTWTSAGCDQAVSGMANVGPAGIGCAMAPVTGSIKVTGTFTATADGMFMDGTTTTGEVMMELAPQCLMISGFMGTCDRLDLEPAGFIGIACVPNTTTMGCTCTVPISQMGGLGAIGLEASQGSATSGTYTAADNKLVLTSAGPPTEHPYCFAGSTLTVAPGTPTNLGTVTGPIVFQKQ